MEKNYKNFIFTIFSPLATHINVRYNDNGDFMKSIKNNIEIQTEIKKSKFITKLFSVASKKEAESYIRRERTIHKNATHVCYAYKLGSTIKCSDDGEPSRTAGIPILNMLNMYDADFILCIVIRYFGGIKLGAGGLLRAYAGCTKEALQKGSLIDLVPGIKSRFSFSYEHQKQIDYYLKDCTIFNKQYGELISYDVYSEISIWETLKPVLLSLDIILETEEHQMIKKE